MALSTARDLKAEVKAAWAELDAPPPVNMRIMDWEYGKDAKRAFVGVRPAGVAIDSAGFSVATLLLALPANAAAAYLGPNLASLLQGFPMPEAIGVFTDIETLSHTIFVLASPCF